jgi:hypothetical protein
MRFEYLEALIESKPEGKTAEHALVAILHALDAMSSAYCDDPVARYRIDFIRETADNILATGKASGTYQDRVRWEHYANT